MVDVINKYETIFIVDASLEEDQITALVEKFKSLIREDWHTRLMIRQKATMFWLISVQSLIFRLSWKESTTSQTVF